jgi:TANFOR domain-containing protein
MYTKSNPEEFSLSALKRKIVILLAAIVTTITSLAQVNPVGINVMVMPPYTSSISDYMTIPNKIVIRLTRTMIDYPGIDLYLKASIIGDNGVSAISENEFKPNFPITLENGAPPYIVNIDNIADAFNLQHIIIQGTTLNELVNGAGLPEGNYQICISAFDFNTGQSLSGDEPVCSNFFSITNLEPPMFTSPICGEPQTSYGNQLVNVSWTKPALSPPMTDYHFELVEIPENVTIDPNEAFLTAKFPVLYEETLNQTMLFLTVDKVSLNSGYTYVMRVTAEDPSGSAHFRNNGTSEVCWFTYINSIESDGSNLIQNDSVDFVFLNPSGKSDTLKVNNESDLLLNWCWTKKTNTGTKVADKEIIDGYGLQKYVLTLAKKQKGESNFSFSAEFQKIDSTGLIQNYLQLTKTEALDADFEDGVTYKAIISVFNSSNQLVRTTESPEFVFKIIKDEIPSIQVPVQAIINYGFKNYPDIFPVSNSEVIIEALISQNSKSRLKQVSSNDSKKQNSIPFKLPDGKNYVKIASIVAKTNAFGQLDTIIDVPEQYLESDSVAISIQLANSYYEDKDFKPLYLKKTMENLTANFGTLTAKTYAYSLKLNVKKEFTSYKIVKNKDGVTVSLEGEESSLNLKGSSNKTNDEQQQYTYQVGKDAVAEGIPVVLYRVNKQEHIPIYEGDLNQSNPPVKDAFTDITVVALGTTQREKDSTYVTFNKLLATNSPDEEYKILAIPNLDALLGSVNANLSDNLKASNSANLSTSNSANLTKSNSANFSTSKYKALTPDLSNFIAIAIKNLDENSSLTNFVDSGKFIASKMAYSLKLPKNTNSEGDYYRTVKANYSIISCTPPTSLIKGRLLYEWISDSKKVKRPLANTHFRVIVDYVDGGGRSIGAVSNSSNALAMIGGGHWETSSFQPEGSNEVIPLVDQYATMGEGKTDNNGNFTINVVNINQKGDLGAGSLIHGEGSKKPPVTGQSLEEKLKEKIGGEEVINPNPYESSFDQFGNDMNSLGTQQNVGLQNSLNGGVFNVGFNAGTQSFELDKVNNKSGSNTMGMIDPASYFSKKYAHGPNPEIPGIPSGDVDFTEQEFSQFRRTFRIVIDGDNAPFYYPSREVIEIQPFESTSSPTTITHFVKEFKLNVKTAEINMYKDTVSLSQLQVTVFRNINDKPEHLPLGEGDGKYTYKELLSPLYNNPGGNAEKYEQLWPNQTVNEQGITGEPLYGLLQSEYSKYFIQASSYVNTGSKAYNSNIISIPEITDTTIDWVNPTIPVINRTVILTPSISRALVLVRDSYSSQPLTSSRNTRVILSKDQNLPWIYYYNNSAPVDKYGYVELLANQTPLSSFNIQNSIPTDIYFSACSDGYKTPLPSQKGSFKTTGYQATPILSLQPTAIIKGRVIDADIKKASSNNNNSNIVNSSIVIDGVEAYIQADSGKVVETVDIFGNFEMPIAPKAGVKVKIIPKDVAWFDTTYVLTVSDEKKQIIDLNTIKLYRRKHRIQFNIAQKMSSDFVGPATRVSGASVQLGQDVMTTTSNGTAKFVFENVSVNNYTFIVRGPKGEGYIPKTVNVKSNESRDFQQVNVELEKGSEITGIVKLDGIPVKNAHVYIEVNNTSAQAANTNYTYQTQYNSQTQSQLNVDKPNTPIIGQISQVETVINSNANAQAPNQQINFEAGSNPNATLKPTGSITDDANLVEARTDAQGKYKLQGIPVDNQKINIIATLDTTYTVSGDKQQANIVNGHAQTDLNLTSYGNAVVNKLYGFPLTIEKITPVNSNQIKVTGLVQWTEALSDFTLKDNNKVLRVEEVLFDLVKNGNGPANAVAHENTVKIPGITNLKMSYIGKYNVELTATGQQLLYNSTPLQITKEEGFGKISGRMQIVDNSFNYPSSYLNFQGSKFYLARLSADSTINNRVSVATSAFSETESLKQSHQKTDSYRNEIVGKIYEYKQYPKPVYYLCSKDAGPITFKLINFVATANPKKSFIDQDGRIHLNTLLTCHIPNAQPEDFSVSIPDMILDENKVYPASSATPIIVKLEEWNLEARNWTFSTSEGGILSTNALLRTKIIDIPVGKFVLRSDMFLMDDFKLEKLSMAGGKFQLQNIKQGSSHLNYEYKVGTDMKPHWNFSLLGSGNTSVATLPGLQGLPNYNIDLNYIEILSNNEMIVQLMQKNNKPLLLGNTVAQFEPLAIFNGPTYIGVSGLLNTGAPRMSDINLTASWTSKDENPTFENVETDFEGKGFVHFEANKQKIAITPDLLTIKGRVLEKPDRTFNPLPATFIARKSMALPKYEVQLNKPWTTQLSTQEPDGLSQPMNFGKGYSLEIESGGMKVFNNDWSTLTYSGTMRANEKNKDNVADSKVNFEVLGDVSANSDQMNIGTNTAFGSFNTCYDFKNKELRGSLLIDEPSGITLGSVVVYKGAIGTCFGEKGFYVAGGMKAFLPMGILAGIYNLGMMAGYHPLTDELWGITNSCINPQVVNSCYKTNTKFFSGFYFAFNREILNNSLTQDYVLASGYVRAMALLGGDFYINYLSGSDWKVGADGYVFVDFSAGLDAITGTSISGSITGDGKIGFQFGNPKENNLFYTSIGLGFSAKIEQELGIETISKSISIDCLIKGDTNSGLSFSLSSGGKEPDCNVEP